MAHTHSGAWRRAQGRGGRHTPAPDHNPNLGAGVDTLHLDPLDPGDPFHEPTPALPETPAYMYAADDFMLPVPVMVDDPIDRSPEGHQAGTVDRGRGTVQAQALAGAAHEVDDGAAAVHHHSPAVMRSVRDTYQTQRLEAEFAVSGSRMALVRGRNSYPENNPDGPPPQGHYVMRWIDRQVSRRAFRPDMMPLLPQLAMTAADVPAPAAGQANQYTSPYAALALARTRKLTTPQVRRVPRPPDDDIQVDGTEDPQYSNPVYWEY